MKYFLMMTLLTLCVSCTSNTTYGPCVGVDDPKDPSKIYKISVNNLFWGIVGFELVLPPIDVVVDKLYCPVGNK